MDIRFYARAAVIIGTSAAAGVAGTIFGSPVTGAGVILPAARAAQEIFDAAFPVHIPQPPTLAQMLGKAFHHFLPVGIGLTVYTIMTNNLVAQEKHFCHSNANTAYCSALHMSVSLVTLLTVALSVRRLWQYVQNP